MEIKMCVCANGHYFNGDIYDTCPECGKVKMRLCLNGHRYYPDIHDSCPECDDDAWGSRRSLGYYLKRGVLVDYGPNNDQTKQSPQPEPDDRSPFDINKPVGPVTCPRGHTYDGYIHRNCPDCLGARTPRVTVPPVPGRRETGPVVGWLVCIEGPMRGTDFPLRDGHNFVGREQGDICLREDPAVAHGICADIGFFSKRRTFYAQHGVNQNYLEVNGEPCFCAVQLCHGDILTVGNTKLRFVPFCDDSFTWEEQI